MRTWAFSWFTSCLKWWRGEDERKRRRKKRRRSGGGGGGGCGVDVPLLCSDHALVYLDSNDDEQAVYAETMEHIANLRELVSSDTAKNALGTSTINTLKTYLEAKQLTCERKSILERINITTDQATDDILNVVMMNKNEKYIEYLAQNVLDAKGQRSSDGVASFLQQLMGYAAAGKGTGWVDNDDADEDEEEEEEEDAPQPLQQQPATLPVTNQPVTIPSTSSTSSSTEQQQKTPRAVTA